MFTGIVEEVGRLLAVEVDRETDSARLVVQGPLVAADAVPGASISVDGVCLTVVGPDGATFAADVMKETLDRSTLGALAPGAAVNLERALRAGDRMGGHVVQGHVDGVGEIVARHSTPAWDVVRIRLPEGLGRYIVEKGSVAVQGTSLTVSALSPPGGDVDGDWFEVSLIPTTLTHTTLGTADIGSRVNLEVDVIAKYVERLVGWNGAGGTGTRAAPGTGTP